MVDAGPEPSYEEKMRVPPGIFRRSDKVALLNFGTSHQNAYVLARKSEYSKEMPQKHTVIQPETR